jgi:NADH:ubiquinone reductase (H+-translocating)
VSLAVTRSEVIIVGGGAGGAELAAVLGRRFGCKTMNVTLVDCATGHLWKPRLHEVAAGLLGPGEDETSYLAIGRANNFRFRLGALAALDPVAKIISISAVSDAEGGELLAARQLRYDTLVLAFGSQVNDFGVPGVVAYCHMLDSGEQALAFQRRLLELAVRGSDGALDRLRVGIVGAGATGVELAAELHHAVSAMHHFGGLMPVSDLEITVVDRATRVLPNNDPATSEFAAQTLERLGIAVRLNASVQEVTADGLVLKDEGLIPCDLKVWAAGVIGRPVASTLKGLQLDRSRRIMCDDHLRCEGVTGVYALGDCALVRDPKTRRPLPATAQVAHQQASYLVRALGMGSRKALGPFAYNPRGALVSLGTEPAAGEIPMPSHSSITFSGRIPKLLYVSLQVMHRAALIGWSRALTLLLADRLRGVTAPPIKLH